MTPKPNSQSGILLGYAMLALTILAVAATGVVYSYKTITGNEAQKNERVTIEKTADLAAAQVISAFRNSAAPVEDRVLPTAAVDGEDSVLPAGLIPQQYAGVYSARGRPIGYCVYDDRPTDPEVRFALVFTRKTFVETTCNAALLNNAASGEKIFLFSSMSDFDRISANYNFLEDKNTVPPTGCAEGETTIYNEAVGFAGCEQEPDTGVQEYALKQQDEIECAEDDIATINDEGKLECLPEEDSTYQGRTSYLQKATFDINAGDDLLGIFIEFGNLWTTDITGAAGFEGYTYSGQDLLDIDLDATFDPAYPALVHKGNLVYTMSSLLSYAQAGSPNVVTVTGECESQTEPLLATLRVDFVISTTSETFTYNVCTVNPGNLQPASTMKSNRESNSYIVPENATSFRVSATITPQPGSEAEFRDSYTGNIDVTAQYAR